MPGPDLHALRGPCAPPPRTCSARNLVVPTEHDLPGPSHHPPFWLIREGASVSAPVSRCPPTLSAQTSRLGTSGPRQVSALLCSEPPIPPFHQTQSQAFQSQEPQGPPFPPSRTPPTSCGAPSLHLPTFNTPGPSCSGSLFQLPLRGASPVASLFLNHALATQFMYLCRYL